MPVARACEASFSLALEPCAGKLPIRDLGRQRHKAQPLPRTPKFTGISLEVSASFMGCAQTLFQKALSRLDISSGYHRF
jgi:hypothetical protein